MKALLAKIRRILRNRRVRQLLYRYVSISAAVVVFVTTYALILPAITMEAEADCGIEAHQHDDDCYEDVLICGLEENDEHTHDASCYQKTLICTKQVHTHDKNCYLRDSESLKDIAVAADDAAGQAGDVSTSAPEFKDSSSVPEESKEIETQIGNAQAGYLFCGF